MRIALAISNQEPLTSSLDLGCSNETPSDYVVLCAVIRAAQEVTCDRLSYSDTSLHKGVLAICAGNTDANSNQRCG